MHIITDKIAVLIQDENFFIQHTDEEGNTTTCFSGLVKNDKYVNLSLIEQLVLARAWFVCTTPIIISDQKSKENDIDKKISKIVIDLSEALFLLGGKEFYVSGIHSGRLEKQFKININNINYACECDIQWYFETYENDFPNAIFKPVFSWWKEETNKKHGDKLTFKKTIDFKEMFADEWHSFLRDRNLTHFLTDMIHYYENKQ